MKNIKWHKFFIVALFVWVANSIATIKLNRVTTIGLVLLIATLFVGCSSCRSTKRYWRKHRCVEVQHKKDNIPTFKTSGKIAVR
jgi:isoprenylcysteine carboxyl methyltransferase (ICMT) family protein YpbQ